jgi:hypothetical protein
MVCKKEMLYCYCFSNLLYNMPQGRSKKYRRNWNCMGNVTLLSMHNHLLSEKTYTTKKNTDASLYTTTEVDIEMKAEKT